MQSDRGLECGQTHLESCLGHLVSGFAERLCTAFGASDACCKDSYPALWTLEYMPGSAFCG